MDGQVPDADQKAMRQSATTISGWTSEAFMIKGPDSVA